MPSHFHSASHSRLSPSSSTGGSSGEARQKGYGREPPSPSSSSGESRLWKKAASGSHVPHHAWASAAGGSPASRASARSTRVCETPTRSSPVSSLLSTNVSQRAQPRPPAHHPRALLLGRQPAQGRSRPATHSDSGRSAAAGSPVRAQQEGDGLGEVADAGVALLEQPVGDAGLLHRPAGEQPRAEQPLHPPAGQEPDGPGRVLRRASRRSRPRAPSTFSFVEVVRSRAS